MDKIFLVTGIGSVYATQKEKMQHTNAARGNELHPYVETPSLEMMPNTGNVSSIITSLQGVLMMIWGYT